MTWTVSPAHLQAAGRIATWVVGALFILATLGALWIGVRGALAYQNLAELRDAAPAAASAVMTNPSQAVEVMQELSSHTRNAHDLTSDAIWAAAEPLPWIGPQLAAVSTIAESSNELFANSLLPLTEAAQDLPTNVLQPVDGRLDTDAIGALAPTALHAASASARAADALDDIDTTPLVGVLSSAVKDSGDLFGRVASSIDALSRAAQLLPSMLGQDGPRSFLLLVQNNAEWRSLGGITGTAILVRSDQGAIQLVDSRSATSLSRGISAPVADLPADLRKIYGARPARFFHNLTQIPDFSVDGPVARDMYMLQTGQSVDGVIAIDPILLSYVLEATGPVSLPGGDSLTSENAVATLLSGAYERFVAPAEQDTFFSGATGAVFDALLSGRGSTSGLITALARAVEERRVLVWSARSDEQAILRVTPLAGKLPVTDGRTARFGVYLNDATGSKMSYYMKPSVALSWGSCRTDNKEITLTVDLTNSAPLDAGVSLPKYVTGNGALGTPPGHASTVLNLYLPEGWDLDSASTTSGTGYTSASFEGRQVLTFGSSLAPQASSNVTVVVRSDAVDSASDAEALVTPTADAQLDPTVEASCERPTVAKLE